MMSWRYRKWGSYNTLVEAGIEKADIVIAVTNSMN